MRHFEKSKNSFLHLLDRYEQDNRPVQIDLDSPNVRVLALPTIDLGQMDHTKWELINVLRLGRDTSSTTLEVGWYGKGESQPYSLFINVFRFVERDPEEYFVCTWEGCKACRLQHRCPECSCPGEIEPEEPKESDLVKSLDKMIDRLDIERDVKNLAKGADKLCELQKADHLYKTLLKEKSYSRLVDTLELDRVTKETSEDVARTMARLSRARVQEDASVDAFDRLKKKNREADAAMIDHLFGDDEPKELVIHVARGDIVTRTLTMDGSYTITIRRKDA